MDPKNEIDPKLLKVLRTLRAIPQRNPQKGVEGRAAFLNEVNGLKVSVSPAKELRHIGWKEKISSIFVIHRKERSPMVNLLTTIFLAISLVFGSGAATVAAANDSLPGEFLYDVKLASENTQLSLATEPETQFDLSLNFVANRADEIQTIINEGEIPSADVMAHFQNQIEQTTGLAVSLPDDRAVEALEQLQTRLETQLQIFQQIQLNGSANDSAALEQVRSMLQERIQLIEVGQTNLVRLREQVQQQEQLNNPGNNNSAPSNAQQGSSMDGQGNPWVVGTPTLGSGYGPGYGTGDCTTCTPSGPGAGQESNPWTTGTPTPYSGYGPGGQPTLIPGQQNGK